MVQTKLRSTTSHIAINYYWERRPVATNSGLLLWFLAIDTTYIRPLTEAEQRQQQVVPELGRKWYGCFRYHNFTQLARADSKAHLRAFVRRYGYQRLEFDYE